MSRAEDKRPGELGLGGEAGEEDSKLDAPRLLKGWGFGGGGFIG